jgi:hypothetical protein
MTVPGESSCPAVDDRLVSALLKAAASRSQSERLASPAVLQGQDSLSARQLPPVVGRPDLVWV